MPVSSSFKVLVGLWAVLEFLAFVAVVRWLGLGIALLAGLLTTALGAGLLKRVGAAAVLRLRAGLSRRGDDASGDLLDGGLRALAAVALLLPGFLGDAVGLALAVPVVRRAVAHRLRARLLRGRPAATAARRGPGAIDLSPDEWSSGATGGIVRKS